MTGVLRNWSQTLGTTPSVAAAPSELSSVWTVAAADGRSYMLKRHASADPLDREHRVLTHLAARAVPVAVPVRTDGVAYTLAPALARDPAPTVGAYERVSVALRRLHRALTDFPERIETYTIELDGLPTQLVHGDCHNGNVLVADGAVTGFVDFANLCYAPRIHDVARYLVDQVLWLLAEPHDREPAFLDAVGDLVRGYEPEERERAALVPAMLASATSLAEWLRVTPGLPTDWPANGAAAVRWIQDRQETLRSRVR